MELNNVHLVVGKSEDGKLTVIYCGTDAAKAESEFREAKDFEKVGISAHPHFFKVRNPKQEAETVKQLKKNAKLAEKREELLAAAKADELRKKAEQLQAEADQLDPKK